MREALTFDDVLLVPQYSDVLPQDTCLASSISGSLPLTIPILSAAMDSVTELSMARAMTVAGGLGIVHKNMDTSAQVSIVKQIKSQSSSLVVGGAVGIGQEGLERADALVEVGIDALVVDTAHGHSKLVLDTALTIKKNYPSVTLIVGNIVSRAAALCLAEIGVDAVKVGIGPGSICTTRIISGVGLPQLTAVIDVSEALRDSSVRVIADGGMRYSGDIVKALAAGAHCVMLGSMLAGTDETPGEVVRINEQAYKTYRGMGSLGAMKRGSAERYFQKNNAKKFVPEGVEGLVPYKGSLDDVLYQILGGIRSGMGYLGAHNLEELRQNAVFARITHSGRAESHIHNLQHIQHAPNYLISK
ncbi:Inosine-5'-monophosphate dehydrogenase,inosine 5'-monophosphate dehydrogenase,L-lactate dehydrogenase (FMN-dependent) and related alpha-hydroxy acid dehydrogenases,inosine-5'-monophosphate dehydrogenase,IMP dehydrogenase / GMP reductase domain [Chlamydia poikilotherma]|uniref:IMP dehydrogenase/GMP reductase domain-containing protein n=1 Tax=Chlamydia poikilotherma TaxID=1967783 RepID=A0A3B0PW21_9CHLA|nr:IMP dehydrogenase [Chlamydia poikilotherma]SYX09046.1 Inosine-5'-monophosphate dehydrogenase,inosine 5'-monophosphate dehydrogenase,L-lactate dehydrogenase (FMN-dependent) and related alpha-hydroxy acid dehydrogenases,inosine-5'-monophosphate dehydrogenase,IMP dehydrogenase / GMP reductase domain [Chlamydia poikilotherma]